jgi:hypothetical protein
MHMPIIGAAQGDAVYCGHGDADTPKRAGLKAFQSHPPGAATSGIIRNAFQDTVRDKPPEQGNTLEFWCKEQANDEKYPAPHP